MHKNGEPWAIKTGDGALSFQDGGFGVFTWRPPEDIEQILDIVGSSSSIAERTMNKMMDDVGHTMEGFLRCFCCCLFYSAISGAIFADKTPQQIAALFTKLYSKTEEEIESCLQAFEKIPCEAPG